MVLFTLPTSYGISQSWDMDFKVLNGVFYPNGFYASIGWDGHNGIDYRCPVGSPVEAVCDGMIEYVGPGNNHPLLSGGGNTVLLRNDELGMRFEYLHLSQQNVYTGQRVKRGQVIALSGNTGISSGAHLHLGAIPVKPNLNNRYRGRVDPTGWLYGPSNPDYAGSAAIAPQGAITTTEEDEMTTEQFNILNDKLERNQQLLLSFQAALTDPVTGYIGQAALTVLRAGAATQYVKGKDEATIYAREDNGSLRGIPKAEWDVASAAGEKFIELPQEVINLALEAHRG